MGRAVTTPPALRPDGAGLPCDAGSRVVHGEGDPGARLVLVGEAPGEQEDREGRPFVGRSGQLLGEALAAAGLAREALWITNAVKCRPTKQQGARLANRAPTPAEIRAWAGVLRDELAAILVPPFPSVIAPACIVALGAVAGRALHGPAFRITRDRGLAIPAPGLAIPVVATWHPAFVLRQAGADRAARLAELIEDLKAARAIAEA